MARVRKRDERVPHAALDRIAGKTELVKRQSKYGCACLSRREYEALYWATWAVAHKPDEGEPDAGGLQKFVAFKVGVSQSTISRWFKKLETVLIAMQDHGIKTGWVLTHEGWWLNVPTAGDPPESLKPIPVAKVKKPEPVLHTTRKIWYDCSGTKKQQKEKHPF